MKNKNILIGIVALVVIVALIIMFMPKAQTAKVATPKKSLLVDDFEDIPKVDSSVKVDLESVVKGQDINLKIAGVPKNTSSIEYELTYATREKEVDGLNGTAKPKEGVNYFAAEFQKQVKLGTCSKNVCRYPQVTSNVNVTIKFEGDYGAKLYQGEFDSGVL